MSAPKLVRLTPGMPIPYAGDRLTTVSADLAAARTELAGLRAATHQAPDAGECAIEAAASR